MNIYLTIWGDILFLIDFSIDFISLYFAYKILSYPYSIKRLLISSVFSAGTSVVFILQKSHILFTVLLSGFIILSICMISLPQEMFSMHRILRLAFVFFILETSAGGFLTVCYSLLGKKIGYIFERTSASDVQIRYFWIFSSLLSIVFYGIYRCLTHKTAEIKRNSILQVTIQGKTIQLPCFFDTGNTVKEPISGLSVIFIPETEPISTFQRFPYMLRAIPLSTISGHSLVYGFKPEKLLIYDKETSNKTEISAYIAYGNFRKRYAVVPSDIMP